MWKCSTEGVDSAAQDTPHLKSQSSPGRLGVYSVQSSPGEPPGLAGQPCPQGLGAHVHFPCISTQSEESSSEAFALHMLLHLWLPFPADPSWGRAKLPNRPITQDRGGVYSDWFQLVASSCKFSCTPRQGCGLAEACSQSAWKEGGKAGRF